MAMSGLGAIKASKGVPLVARLYHCNIIGMCWSLLFPAYVYTIPWAIIALATFMKPATFAPFS